MSEFGLIDKIKSMSVASASATCEGIGDDCAVLRINDEESMLYTTDLLIERVHFLSDSISAFDLGAKALAVNLSDVAAMGARPSEVLLSLALPERFLEAWVLEFMRGLESLALKHSVSLIGGDTTRSMQDLAINITAMGREKNIYIKRRSAAKVGDIIFVTGELGRSAAGLKDILSGKKDTLNAKIHSRPTPRVDEGEWLGRRAEVRAMMDISDGIGSDLRHILRASSCGARIDLEKIPTSVSLEEALSGGEDYELLFTCEASLAGGLAADYFARFGSPLYAIGEITEEGSLLWLRDGEPQNADFRGFQHF